MSDSRRAILAQTFGLFSLVAATAKTNAADMCPAEGQAEATRVFDQLRAAYEARDSARILAMLDDEFYFEDPTSHFIARSREEMRPFIEPVAKLYRELKVTSISRINAPPWVISQHHIAGVIAKDDGSTRRIDVQGLTMLQIRGGKVVRWYDYYDVLSFRKQSQ